MDVGVRELKQRLSHYLDRVAKGEVIRVTERGRPKALLTPIRDARVIERGLAEGWLTAGIDNPPEPVQPVRTSRSVLEVLREDRDGR